MASKKNAVRKHYNDEKGVELFLPGPGFVVVIDGLSTWLWPCLPLIKFSLSHYMVKVGGGSRWGIFSHAVGDQEVEGKSFVKFWVRANSVWSWDKSQIKTSTFIISFLFLFFNIRAACAYSVDCRSKIISSSLHCTLDNELFCLQLRPTTCPTLRVRSQGLTWHGTARLDPRSQGPRLR